jgi:hypothetical protein
LRGLYESPNQLALVCVTLGLLALHFLETAHELRDKFIAFIRFTLAIVVGKLTEAIPSCSFSSPPQRSISRSNSEGRYCRGTMSHPEIRLHRSLSSLYRQSPSASYRFAC